MKVAYTFLSSGRSSDWGTCLLIDESIGKVLLGETHIKELPEDVINFLCEGNVTEKKLENLEEEFFDKNEMDAQYSFTLCNLIYNKKSPYVLKFEDIGDLANYVREHDIHVDYHLET